MCNKIKRKCSIENDRQLSFVVVITASRNKRKWKLFYGTVKGLILFLHKVCLFKY